LNSNNLSLRIWIIILILITNSCYAPQEWEDLESDLEPVLNVYGLISLDPDVNSFVRIYRTTDLEELSAILVGIDSIWYSEEDDFWWIDSIYEPANIITDAVVTVWSGEDSTQFHYVPREYSWEFDKNNYQAAEGLFTPQANTSYHLSIVAPGFDTVTGYLTTPEIPVLIDSLIQDSVSRDQPYEIFWQTISETKGFISGSLIYEDQFVEENGFVDICGAWFERVVDLDDGHYTLPPEFCLSDTGFSSPIPYYLRLVSMDENYYEYFILGETGDYSNFLLDAETTIGRAVGIEGGYGLFGAIGSHAIELTFLP